MVNRDMSEAYNEGYNGGFVKGCEETEKIAVFAAKTEYLRGIRETKEKMKGLGVTAIQNNLHKSFMGKFSDALKNGYTMDKHYVIVDWVFFHELLKKEKELEK